MTLEKFLAALIGSNLLIEIIKYLVSRWQKKRDEGVSIILTDRDELREVRRELRERNAQLEKLKDELKDRAMEEIRVRDMRILELEYKLKEALENGNRQQPTDSNTR